MASPITIFRKAWEFRNHKVAALKNVPMSEQNSLAPLNGRRYVQSRRGREVGRVGNI
jgi:hypothetical protein